MYSEGIINIIVPVKRSGSTWLMRNLSANAPGITPGNAVDATSAMFLMDSVNAPKDLKWTADIVVVGNLASLEDLAGHLASLNRRR